MNHVRQNLYNFSKVSIYIYIYIYGARVYIYIYIYMGRERERERERVRRSLNKFPDFFVWALLLIVHKWNSSPLPSNALIVSFQQLLGGPMEVPMCEPIIDLRHSLISSTVSYRQPLSLGNYQKSQGAKSGL